MQSLGMGIDFLNLNPDQLCELGQGIQPLCAHFSIHEMGTIVLLPLWVCCLIGGSDAFLVHPSQSVQVSRFEEHGE